MKNPRKTQGVWKTL